MLALLIIGRCWATLKLPGIMPPIDGILVPRARAASLEPVELVGLSMSMLAWLSALPVLLCLRCRLEDVLLREPEEAPGPGVTFIGAAAMGTTDFPPIIPADDPVLP
jgi:hypothetical protein